MSGLIILKVWSEKWGKHFWIHPITAGPFNGCRQIFSGKRWKWPRGQRPKPIEISSAPRTPAAATGALSLVEGSNRASDEATPREEMPTTRPPIRWANKYRALACQQKAEGARA